MNQFAGCCRYMYNKALALQKENHEARNKYIPYESMAKILTTLRNGEDIPWLKKTPCHPLQQALNLET